MKKVMLIMLISVGILFGCIFLWKWYQFAAAHKKAQALAAILPTVSATQATRSLWKSQLQVVGSSRAVKGVNVTTELPGMIREITLVPGSEVIQGQLLVQLNIDPEVAKLHSLQAEAEIAEITYHRNQKQYRIGGVSKETLDQNEADYKSTKALVEQQLAIIAKKTIRAPFSGRLGICVVYPGQYINPGDKIASLQTLKPIYVDFYLPQENIPQIAVGQNVDVSIDAYPKETFTGKITTINPIVDKDVRNIEVEATLANEDEKILPDMFTYVSLKTGEPKSYITLPQMAITFNPYGSIIYILKLTNQLYKGQKVWQVSQKFVETGEVRGDQISVLSGVEEGDWVVTSGQLKIKNGSLVVLNNKIQPENNPNPYLPTD